MSLSVAKQRSLLVSPNPDSKVLMHSCCAPCAGELMEAMLDAKIPYEIFFYNPNIHPKREYEIRKLENIKFAEKYHIPFIDADYDSDNWFTRTKGMGNEPERGIRCTACFDMRFERTALYAYENGFQTITSSLGISRWKNMDQINDSGVRSASHYPGVTYWTYNWRKFGGAERMYQIAKRENMYKQEYCGCVFSLRDTNEWREKTGREKIKIGEQYYEEKLREESQ